MTMPPTHSSLPFFMAAPIRTASPILTSATSRIYVGVPFDDLRTIFSMSLTSFINPTPRTIYVIGTPFQYVAADVFVVAADRGIDVVHGYGVFQQFLRRYDHLVLLEVTA